MPLKVLFLCIGNSCRSPMAEAIARGSAGDAIEASSAGLVPLGYVARMTKQTLEKNGYSAEQLASKSIEPEIWKAAELVINMSGRPREGLFGDWDKVEDWEIEDPYGADPEVYQRIFEEIERRVNGLTERLRKRAEKPAATEE